MQRLLLSSCAIALFFLTGCPHSAVDVGELDPGSLGGSGGNVPGTGGSALGGAVSEGGAMVGAGGEAGALGGAVSEGGAMVGAGGEAGALGGAVGAGGAAGAAPFPGALGAACDIGIPVAPAQGAFNSAADDCASGLCLKLADATGIADTSPLCSADCATDADCDGLMRDPASPTDHRCKTGFSCGIAFVKGRLCCRNLCICQDFTGGPITTVPIACQGDAASSCL